MNKLSIFFSTLLVFSMVSCSNNKTPNGNDNEPGGDNGSIIHGHGAPQKSQGSLYSLYVDDDNGKIYEKNKVYTPSSPSGRYMEDDGGEWLYTNCNAGSNFNKNSPVADAIRATLLSTNITLRCDLNIETTSGGQTSAMEVVTYLQYNFGNVLQKHVTGKDDIDDAMLIGYSTYDINSDSYRLFINSGGTITEHTEYITSDNPQERLIASNFINRCLNNQLENTFNFALADYILSEIDNFKSSDNRYALDKVINITSNPYYDQIYGPGNYYIEFKDINFELSEDNKSLKYIEFGFEYGKKDKSEVMKEILHADISHLRTTSFDIPA